MKRMHWIIGAVLLAGAFLLGLDGLSLAKEEAEPASPGQLIGAYITTEYVDLFDVEAWLNDHANQLVGGGNIAIENDAAYRGRIYAEILPANPEEPRRRSSAEYRFPGVEGIPCFFPIEIEEGEEGSYVPTTYIGNVTSAGLTSRVHSKHAEDGTDLEIEATLYAAIDSPISTFYINPVFQDEAGNVYLESGQGISSEGGHDAGMLMSTKLEVTTSEKAGDVERESTNSIEITIELVEPAAELGIAYMDANHSLLKAEAYASADVPATLDPGEAAYLILESRSAKQEVLSRSIHGPGDDHAYYFTPLESGICERTLLLLEWD